MIAQEGIATSTVPLTSAATPRPWRRIAGHAAAIVVAVAVACLLFLYRFNALGGALGGFENDEFIHLMRTDMILDGQQPLRDFVDYELRGAWPSLSYQVPAWAQEIWGRNLLAEAYLTVGAMAACTGAAFLITRHISARWWLAAVATATVFVSGPKPYNYPKLLVLTLAAVSLSSIASKPSAPRLALMAASTAIAVLFRHDYGVYLALAAMATLAARERMPSPQLLRQAGIYVALTTAFLLPSIVWVQRYEGVVSYLSHNFANAVIEGRTRSLHGWPVVDLSTVLDDSSLIALAYYVCWTMPVIGVAVLALGQWGRVPRGEALRALGWGFVVLAIVVNMFFLRSNLDSRFGDAMIAVVALAAWITRGADAVLPRVLRVALQSAPVVLLALMTLALFRVNLIARELNTAGLTVSSAMTAARFREVQGSLRALPPVAWTDGDAQGGLAAARYLAECTSPNEYVMVGDYAGEIPVFARRHFAGGQATLALGFYRSQDDQQRFLRRIATQSVPIVLGAEDYETGFAQDYPLIANYLSERYRRAGTIDANGETRFLVFVDASRAPVSVHAPLGLPCFR